MAWVIILEILFAVVGVALAYLYIHSGRKSAADWIIAVLIVLFVWVFCTTFLLLGVGQIKAGI
ncbi:MAG: hypothetical protein WAN89_07305 [Lawsonella sp.]